jgi:lysine/ornithine N-monooxygenase
LLRHLVTPRNPRSHFSLINFLHCQGRLLDHLNQAWEFLLWREYAEYMAWVASHFDDVVPYGQAATSIEVVDTEDGEGGYAYCSFIASAGAASTSVITYVAPAVAVAVGVLVLGESLAAGGVAGLLLVLAGSWLATGGRPLGRAAWRGRGA